MKRILITLLILTGLVITSESVETHAPYWNVPAPSRNSDNINAKMSGSFSVYSSTKSDISDPSVRLSSDGVQLIHDLDIRKNLQLHYASVGTKGYYYNYGQSWVSGNSFSNLQEVVMSTDTTVQTVICWTGPTYVSTDTGRTWKMTDSVSRENYVVDLSGDGKTQIRGDLNGYVWTSTDTGQTWKSNLNQGSYGGVAASRDGLTLSAVSQGGYIFVSTNSGVTWTQPFIITGAGDCGKGIFASGDGSVQLVLTDDEGLYVSTNTGSTWTQNPFPNIHFTGKGGAVTPDGRIMIACDEDSGTDGRIVISTNTGRTWRKTGSSESYGFVDLSDDGNVIVAGGGQNVFVSTDVGVSWSQCNPFGATAYNVAMTPDASFMIANVSPGTIYTSRTPYAVDPLIINSSGGDVLIGNPVYKDSHINIDGHLVVYSTVSASALKFPDGTVITSSSSFTSVTPGGFVKRSGDDMYGLLTLSSFTAVSGTIGTDEYSSIDIHYNAISSATVMQSGVYSVVLGSWTNRGYTYGWQSIAMSTDGIRQVLASRGGNGSDDRHVWLSSDSGVTWTRGAEFNNPNAVATSANGEYIIVANEANSVQLSSNYGSSWSEVGSYANVWYDADMSDDGSIQVTIPSTYGSGQGIRISTNTGADWVLVGPSGTEFCGIDVSSSAVIQTAISLSGQIFVSSNSGTDWTAYGPSKAWRSQGIAMSSDGTVQSAIESSGFIWVSTNCGLTWSQRGTSRSWTGISMNATGLRQTAVCNNGFIYVSSDRGETWTPQDSERLWSTVAMSSDGLTRTATVRGGDFWATIPGNIFTYNENTVGGYRTISMNSEGGNVSIGTTSTLGKLTVDGSIVTTSSITALGGFFGNASSATDSDMLDGQHGSYYAVRDDVASSTASFVNKSSDTMTGKLTVSPTATDDYAFVVNQSTNDKGILVKGNGIHSGRGIGLRIESDGGVALHTTESAIRVNQRLSMLNGVSWGTQFMLNLFGTYNLQIVRGTSGNNNVIVNISTGTTASAGNIVIGSTVTDINDAKVSILGTSGAGKDLTILISTVTDATAGTVGNYTLVNSSGLRVNTVGNDDYALSVGIAAVPNGKSIKTIGQAYFMGGIFTGATGLQLDAYGTNYAQIYTKTSNDRSIIFKTNATDKVIISSVGYLGVGTMSPATKMHMSSGVLTLDGVGCGIALANIASCDVSSITTSIPLFATGLSSSIAGTPLILTSNNEIVKGSYGIKISSNIADGITLDNTYGIVKATGTCTIVLPAASTCYLNNVGAVITVKNVGTGSITVARQGSDTIDGDTATTYLITSKQSFDFFSDGVIWWIK